MQKSLPLAAAVLAGFCLGALTSFSRRSDVNTERFVAAPPPRDMPVAKAKEIRSTTLQTADQRFDRIASALQETISLKRRHALYEALGKLDATSMRQVIARAEQLPRQYSFLLSPLLERWLALDRNAAIAWVRAHPNLRDAWMTWARIFPETALTEARANPHAPMAKETLREAVTTLVGKDKPAVAAKLATLDPDPGRDNFLFQTVMDWATEEPRAAFLFTRNLPDAQRMTALFDYPLRRWVQREPERAKEEVETFARQTSERARALGLIAYVSEALAQTNPVRALEWLNGLPDNCRALASYVAIAATWAERDPVAALEWCAANGIDASVSTSAGGWGGTAVIFGAIKNHPEETLRWLEALPSDGNRDTLLEGALTAHSKWTAPDASLEDSQRMLAAMATLPADAQERVVRNLGARQAERTNLEEVHAWVERLPDAALRAAAIVAFAQNALSRRTQEKEQLMAEFSRVEERDAMLRGIASWEADFAPRTAAELALEIADPQQRHDALDDCVIGWLHGDPPAARQWLTNSARIPAEWSAAWLAEAERTR